MADAHKKFKYAIEVRGLPDSNPSSLVRQLRILLLTHKVEDFWLKLVETPGKRTRTCIITFRNEADAAYCARKFNNFKFKLERKNKQSLNSIITAKMIKNYDRDRSPGIEVWNSAQESRVFESDSLSKLDMEIELLKRQRSVVEEERKLLMERKKIEMIMEYSQAPNLPSNSGYIESRPFLGHNTDINLQSLLPLPVNPDFIQNPPQARNEPILRDDLRHSGRSPVNVQYGLHRELDHREPSQRIISNNVKEPIMRDELRYRERSPIHRQYESHEYNIAAPRPTNPLPVLRNEIRHMDERPDNPRDYKEIHHRKPTPQVLPMTTTISQSAFKSQKFGPTSVKGPVPRDEFRHMGRSPARNFNSRENTDHSQGRQTIPQMVPRPSGHPEYPIELNSHQNDPCDYNNEIRRVSPARTRPVIETVWEPMQPFRSNAVKKPEALRQGRSPARKHDYNRQPSPHSIRGPFNSETRKPVWETNEKFDPATIRERPVERERYRERSPTNRRDTREYNKDIHRRQPSPRPVPRSNEIRKHVWEPIQQFGHAVNKPTDERDEFSYREKRNDSREYNRNIRQSSPRAVQRPTNRQDNKPVWESNQQYGPTKEALVQHERGRSPGRIQDVHEYDRDGHRRQPSPRPGQRPSTHEGRKSTWESNQKLGPAFIKESQTELEVRYRERSPPRRRDSRERYKEIPRDVQRSTNHETRKSVWEPNSQFGHPYEKEPTFERGFGDRDRMEDVRPRDRQPDRARETVRSGNVLPPNSGSRLTRKEKRRNSFAVPCRIILMTMSAVMEKYATKNEMIKLPQLAQLAIADRLALIKQDNNKFISCLDDVVSFYRSAYPTSTDDVFIKDLLNTMRTTAAAAWEPESKQFNDFCDRRMSVRAEKTNLRATMKEQEAIEKYAFAMDRDWNMEDVMAWKRQSGEW